MLRQPPPPPPLYEPGGYRPSPSATLPKQAHRDKAELAAAPGQAPPLGLQARVRSPTRDAQTEQQQLRRKINSRERKRMQDLNLAMDALREVILPYSAAHCQSTPGRKLSKIATLLLARNYILLLGSSLQELRRVLGDISGSAGVPRLLLAGLPLFAAAAPSAGPVLLAAPSNGNHHHHHHHHHHPPHSDGGGSGGLRSANKYLSLALEEQQAAAGGRLSSATSSLCPCALCKFPHFVPSPPGLVALGPVGVQAQFSK